MRACFRVLSAFPLVLACAAGCSSLTPAAPSSGTCVGRVAGVAVDGALDASGTEYHIAGRRTYDIAVSCGGGAVRLRGRIAGRVLTDWQEPLPLGRDPPLCPPPSSEEDGQKDGGSAEGEGYCTCTSWWHKPLVDVEDWALTNPQPEPSWRCGTLAIRAQPLDRLVAEVAMDFDDGGRLFIRMDARKAVELQSPDPTTTPPEFEWD